MSEEFFIGFRSSLSGEGHGNRAETTCLISPQASGYSCHWLDRYQWQDHD